MSAASIRGKNMGKTGAFVFQIALLLLALVGGWLGFSYIGHVSGQVYWDAPALLGAVLVTVVAAVIGLLLNVVLHEAGHLICGLLTGYGFVLYSVFGQTFMKEKGKLVRKRYSFAGAGGGCMLSPPDRTNGTYPFKLYISGGFIVDFLLCILFLILFFLFAPTAALWARVFLVIAIVSAFLGLINLAPHKVALPSDGYILFNLGKDKNAEMRHGFWSVLKIQTLIAEGIRPRDIPTKLFDWVDMDALFDIFVFETARNRYLSYLDRLELSKAEELMQTLSKNMQDMPDAVQLSCNVELLFHEMIGKCRQEKIDSLFDKRLKDFMKAASSDISVCRTLYTYARLILKDETKAKEEMELFQKACSMPLHSGAAPGEQELIAIVDEIADERDATLEP